MEVPNPVGMRVQCIEEQAQVTSGKVDDNAKALISRGRVVAIASTRWTG